jgi:Ca2+-binding EF-hand superfamily protein
MIVSLLLIAGAGALQAAQPAAAASPAANLGRSFLSPMGETFYGRTAGEDGLVPWFEQADRNHDGSLTAVEMIADAQRYFQVLDSNHDGEIDPDEMAHYEEITPQLRARSIVTTTRLPGGEQDVQVDNETSAGRLGLLQIPQPVSSADTNFNRGVSLAEFSRAANDRFALLDFRRTGRLTLSELQDVRRAAATQVSRKRNRGESNPSDNPSSAEYGRPPR